MRRKHKETDIHHRKARSNGGDNSDNNVVKVIKSKHQAFHHLFYDGSPQKVANILNRSWIDIDYKLVVVKRKEEDFDGVGIS